MTCSRCGGPVSAHWPGAPRIAVSHVVMAESPPEPFVCSAWPGQAVSLASTREQNLARLLSDAESW